MVKIYQVNNVYRKLGYLLRDGESTSTTPCTKLMCMGDKFEQVERVTTSC